MGAGVVGEPLHVNTQEADHPCMVLTIYLLEVKIKWNDYSVCFLLIFLNVHNETMDRPEIMPPNKPTIGAVHSDWQKQDRDIANCDAIKREAYFLSHFKFRFFKATSKGMISTQTRSTSRREEVFVLWLFLNF